MIHLEEADSIGKPGSPTIGVRIDYDLAREVLEKLNDA